MDARPEGRLKVGPTNGQDYRTVARRPAPGPTLRSGDETPRALNPEPRAPCSCAYNWTMATVQEERPTPEPSWDEHYRDERDAAFLYRRLAAVETDVRRRDLFG